MLKVVLETRAIVRFSQNANQVTMRREFCRAQIPKGKIPGAGRRVNLERRRQQGEQEIDALPGDA